MAARIGRWAKRLHPHLLAIFVSDASPGRLATTTSFGASPAPFSARCTKSSSAPCAPLRKHGIVRFARSTSAWAWVTAGAITGLLLADAQLSVTGVDNEPKMIKKARERLTADRSSGRLKIVLDDTLHFLTNQPSHAFDIIASGYVLHNLIGNYRARLYDEIWRVLAPSGLFVNADKYAQTVEAHREALRWQLNRFFDVFVPRQRYDLLREWVLHYVEDEAAGRVMPEADAITRLNDLGFADVRIAYRRYMDAVLIAHKP
jgi:SAM-dependent methyltransferase